MNVIALDAMGGDDAPRPEVHGALAAVRESNISVVLVGDEGVLKKALHDAGGAENDRLSIRHASEVVTMEDHPGTVFRKKLDSSMRVAADMVVAKEADAVVSAGNSGAMLSHSMLLFKRMPGVERPGIAQIIPTPSGTITMCDLGANIVAKPVMLAQFGVLAAHFHRIVRDVPKPRVAILSNGTEDTKGTQATRKASLLLANAAKHPDAGFRYVGYIEGSSLFTDEADVIATDGFTGNVVLKTLEGASEALMRMMRDAITSSVRGKLGGLLVKPALLNLKQSIHYSEFGGAMLLGVNGTATICHGRSNARAICTALQATNRFLDKRLQQHLNHAIERHQDIWDDQKGQDT